MVLTNAGTRVALDAAQGGAIREFSWRDLPVLRPAAADADTVPFSMACFPLVPYANRIAQGRFRFDGREIQLRRNWDQDTHPLHGQGWRSAWTIDRTSSSTAVMSFDGGGDDWPWRYRAIQELTVLPDGLEVRLSVQNQSDQDMPGMLGLHPYFPNPAAATLEARARSIWLTDAQALPVQEVLTPPEWSFDQPRGMARAALDHCFDHWDGLAIVRWPDRVLNVSTTGAQSLHIYAPAGADFFCLEPQTAAVGALNRESRSTARGGPPARQGIKVRFLVGGGAAQLRGGWGAHP
jgi:aldose 1-epimerase